MCDCQNVGIGTYANQVELKAPSFMLPLKNILGEEKGIDVIPVDRCLAGEIQYLWGKGITTTGCCCGHNQMLPYIGVAPEDVEKMLDMGYIVRPNELDLDRNDSFYPKSVIMEPKKYTL